MALAGARTQKTAIAREEDRKPAVNFSVVVEVDSRSFAHMIPYIVVIKN
jgi:hypothetical protein